MFEIKNADGGGFFWRLRALGNNEILCHSEVYVTKQNAREGIEAAIKAACSGPGNIEDLT